MPGGFVWQIHSRLRIDLPGDFAHGVQLSVHLIQRLRLIAQTETAPACDLPKSDKEDAATATAPRTENPNLASAEPCCCLRVMDLCRDLAEADVSDTRPIRFHAVTAHVFGKIEAPEAFGNRAPRAITS